MKLFVEVNLNPDAQPALLEYALLAWLNANPAVKDVAIDNPETNSDWTEEELEQLVHLGGGNLTLESTRNLYVRISPHLKIRIRKQEVAILEFLLVQGEKIRTARRFHQLIRKFPSMIYDVEWCENYRTSGYAQLNRRALRHAREVGLAEVREDELTRAKLLEAHDRLFGKVKGNTAAGHWGRWHRAWKWAADRDMVSLDSLPRVERRKLGPGDRTQKRALRESEVLDLLAFGKEYSGGRYFTLLWTLAETAARIGQLGKLDVDDFHWAGPGTPGRIRAAWKKVKNKADHYSLVSPGLAAAIAAEIEGREVPQLFLAARRGRINAKSLDHMMDRWRGERGLLGQVDVQSFRRYCVSRLEELGVPQAIGMKVTGHRSAQIYARYAEKGQYKRIDEAARKLWLGVSTSLSTLSTPADKLGSQDQPSSMVVLPSGESHPDLRDAFVARLAAELVHACPLLGGLPEVELLAAVERSLSAVLAMDP